MFCALALPATADVQERAFDQCLSDLKAQAGEQGISADTRHTVFGDIRQLDRVIELDRRQPEFTTPFSEYFGRRVTDSKVEKGRELLAEHRGLLQRVERETGVPAPYLVAFWGMETHFGSYFGKMPVPSALATLACDRRRANYFTGELMAALKIIDEGAIAPSEMEGSWAGAMGHVQFMPSVFLKHAVDADGDGRRDLWHSLPDAMMSAGHFLAAMGWDGDYRWGREVRLPDDFDYSVAGLDKPRPLSFWRNQGVRTAFDTPLPRAEIKASLLVPSGHRGPAFLVYDNFHVIMGWNQSEYYALSVGHLADRIAGAGRLQQTPPDDSPRLSRDQVVTLQTRLNERGYDAGEPDGIPGPATRGAVRAWQKDHGHIADGHLSPTVLDAFNIALNRAEDDA
ncbi:membrane-bound lytic murein transglycosylase B [Tamilnaduibacter salinus]|uniref:Membrane-bound lytic murein transglycosylase B n=1 Tax=Tamilnaduibacter salinus TaxID=1484056 RepID=A0A2U1CWG1_9GAMM|nr:lytic murein transglycosylase [Tamilnaduibacter salinus]PVY76345.1 membrane-bound lytic murein transglycosylase B [Tamilnaduibacter salinus]